MRATLQSPKCRNWAARPSHLRYRKTCQSPSADRKRITGRCVPRTPSRGSDRRSVRALRDRSAGRGKANVSDPATLDSTPRNNNEVVSELVEVRRAGAGGDRQVAGDRGVSATRKGRRRSARQASEDVPCRASGPGPKAAGFTSERARVSIPASSESIPSRRLSVSSLWGPAEMVSEAELSTSGHQPNRLAICARWGGGVEPPESMRALTPGVMPQVPRVFNSRRPAVSRTGRCPRRNVHSPGSAER
jgi:hypothetical protein